MGNALIGPAINAPPDLPFISFAERTHGGWTWKLPAVKRYAGERSVAWLVDDPGSDVDAWATRRGSLTLIIRPILSPAGAGRSTASPIADGRQDLAEGRSRSDMPNGGHPMHMVLKPRGGTSCIAAAPSFAS